MGLLTHSWRCGLLIFRPRCGLIELVYLLLLPDHSQETPLAIRKGVHCLCETNPVATAPGSVPGSVPYSYAKGAAVVAIVVVINGEIQTAVSGRGEGQLTADQKGLGLLAIRRANVADERAGACARYWLGADNRAETARSSTFRPDFTRTAARNDGSGSRESDLIASAHIQARVCSSRCSWHINGHFLRRAVPSKITGRLSRARANSGIAPSKSLVRIIERRQIAFAPNLNIEAATC